MLSPNTTYHQVAGGIKSSQSPAILFPALGCVSPALQLLRDPWRLCSCSEMRTPRPPRGGKTPMSHHKKSIAITSCTRTRRWDGFHSPKTTVRGTQHRVCTADIGKTAAQSLQETGRRWRIPNKPRWKSGGRDKQTVLCSPALSSGWSSFAH